MPDFIKSYLHNVAEIAKKIDQTIIEDIVNELFILRERGGRLFFLGVGGSAANCSHAVNDFRKLCGIETYTPVDNVSELTARTNDEGWDTVFSSWLNISNLNSNDALFILSVGGGDAKNNVSPNLISAIDLGKNRGSRILGIVGKNGGYTKEMGHSVLVIPSVDASQITPHAEAFQAVIWHCLVSHPKLQRKQAKWESLATV